MKRLIVCMAVMMSLLIGSASLANAETTDIVRLERVHYTSADGTQMTDVTVNTSFVCGGFEGVLKYDDKKLTYAGFENNVALENRNTRTLSTRDTGDGIRTVVLGYPKTGTQGDFVTFTFEGNSAKDFGIRQAVFADAKGNEVRAKVIDVMLGDATGDFTVDILDLVRLKKQVAGQDCGADIWNSDCDRSGAVENNDLVQLRKFLCAGITEF